MVQHSHLFPTFTHYTSPTPKPHIQTNMKFILFASIISFAVAAAVGSADNADTNLEVNNNIISGNIYSNNINYSPYGRTLSKDDCNDIVNAFISVLQNKRYRNKSPRDTYKRYLAKDFKERSGSINSLISKDNNVKSHPIAFLAQQNTNNLRRSTPTSSTTATRGSEAYSRTQSKTSRPARSTSQAATNASGSGNSAAWAAAATMSTASICCTFQTRRRLPVWISSSTALLGVSTPVRSTSTARSDRSECGVFGAGCWLLG
jgi:hypothetical protein